MGPSETDLAIIKQCASKLTGFGFPNEPRAATVEVGKQLSDSVYVATVKGLVPGGNDCHALVVIKHHSPVPAHHVVDFRVGTSIYG